MLGPRRATTSPRGTCGSSSRSSRAGTWQPVRARTREATATTCCCRWTPTRRTPSPMLVHLAKPGSPSISSSSSSRCPTDDLRGHARTREGDVSTPICLDESIESARDAATAIALDALARVINIKPAQSAAAISKRAGFMTSPSRQRCARVVWRHAGDRRSAGRPMSPWPRCPASYFPATRRPPNRYLRH
jgi:hypothetical protein